MSSRSSPSALPRYARFLLAAAVLFAPVAGACAPEPSEDGDSEGVEEHLVQQADTAPVALVSGSTAGLGRALALALGSEGYHVIVHGRNEERGREVVEAIAEEGRGSARFLPADFARLEEVQALAELVSAEYERLDLLVNNAGVGPGTPGHRRVVTPDGHELRFQVNYLAGYLLTRELLPLLEAGAPSRIVNVSSRSQRPLDFEDLALERDYSGGEAYGRSKLAQILHVQELAQSLEGTGVTAVAVHPAPAMATGLVLETGGTPQSTVEDGLRSVLNAIRSEAPSGTFFFELEPQRAHEQAYDAEARRMLRELSDDHVERALGGGD